MQCSVGCISKLNEKEYDHYKDCDVYSIENIREEKKKTLNENVKYLQDLSNNLEYTIN